MRKSAIIYKIFRLNYIFLLVSNLGGKYLDAAPIFIGYIYSLCQNGIKLRISVILWLLSLANTQKILNIDKSCNEFFIIKICFRSFAE